MQLIYCLIGIEEETINVKEDIKMYNRTETPSIGRIYYLSDYNWEIGSLLKENRTTYQIDCGVYGIKNIKKDKCALPNEMVCVVWETWRGNNGRGGYRVEKQKYGQLLIPAKNVARQHREYFENNNATGRIKEWQQNNQFLELKKTIDNGIIKTHRFDVQTGETTII